MEEARHITIHPQAQVLIEMLEDAKYESYAVGGSVRDALLGRTPKDWDICTSALPDETLAVFDGWNTRFTDTGYKNGTIVVRVGEEDFEITTFRSDGEYSDSRRPDEVFFGVSLFDDLARRDFTINAMAYNENTGIVDPFNGLQDLDNGIVRCVGDARERFSEDPLRMLRCIRFSVKYGFHIEDETFGALAELHKKISLIVSERIRDEFDKILVLEMDFSDVSFLMILARVFLPAWSDISIVSKVPCDVATRLAVGLRHLETSGIIWALEDLKYNNDTVKEVCFIIYCLRNNPDEMLKPDVKRLMMQFGAETYDKALQIQDALGLLVSWQEQEFIRVLETREPYLLPDLEVDGNDMISLGLEGRKIGNMLSYLLDIVMISPEMNTPEDLMRIAENAIENDF